MNVDNLEGVAVGIETTNKDVSEQPTQQHLIILAEIWERTVRDNPAIAQEFGEFSGEILHRMLGIQLGSHLKSSEVVDSAQKNHIENPHTPVSVPLSQDRRSERLMTQTVNIDDNDQDEIPEYVCQSIAFPNARLVRSLRRCDKKLLPILDEWVVVDVAVTRFEIVYFDAVEAESSIDQKAVLAETRQLLISTKGGKGLRLADVAKGQRVVGRMLLEDIRKVFS